MTRSPISGRAWRFGDDIDTDVIVPSQYMHDPPEEYADHVFEPVDPDFAGRVEAGDVIVAESNFGIGSSREHAAIGLVHAGIGAVVAVSFGRIFYRNAINQGLPAVECDPDLPPRIDEGDDLELDPFEGVLRNLTTGETHDVTPLTDPERAYIAAGGAVEYHRQS